MATEQEDKLNEDGKDVINVTDKSINCAHYQNGEKKPTRASTFLQVKMHSDRLHTGISIISQKNRESSEILQNALY